jgi:hypothetical protein
MTFLLASDVYIQYNSKSMSNMEVWFIHTVLVMQEWLAKVACCVDLVMSTNRDWRLKGCGIVKEQL